MEEKKNSDGPWIYNPYYLWNRLLVMAGVKVEDTFQKWLRESKLLEVSKDYISIYLDLSKGNAMKIVERRHKRDSKSYYIKVI